MIREIRQFVSDYRWPIIGGLIACIAYAQAYGW